MSRIMEMTYREAIVTAQREAMLADERVVLLGEDIGAAGGPFKTTDGLQAQFGASRVRDTPISEQAFVGAALGLALTGYRPIVELMFADFMAVCYDQIVNNIAKHRFMQGGRFDVPLVIRAIGGGGTRFGAQHSQTGESWLAATPGLKVWCAASPQDAYQMIRAATTGRDPVVVIEHKLLLNRRGPVEVAPSSSAFDAGPRCLRAGRDITLIATLGMVERALAAAVQLEHVGVQAEVFDLRVIRPLRLEGVVASVRKTNRVLLVEESHCGGGWSAEVAAQITREAFDYLDAPPERITLPEWPIPYSPALEDAALPSVDAIVTRARAMLG